MSGVGAFNGSAAEKRRLLRGGAAKLFAQGVPGVDEWASALLREVVLNHPGVLADKLARRIPVGFVFGDQERTVLRGLRLQRVLRAPLPEHEAELIGDALKLLGAHVRPGDMRWAELEKRPGDWPAPVGKVARETRRRVLALMRTFTQDMPSSVRDLNMADRAAALIGPLGWKMEIEAVLGLFKKLVSPGTGLSCACWSENRRVYARVIDRSGAVVATLVLPATAAFLTPEKPASRQAWQIEKDLARLREERRALWRSDFETTDGRLKYADQWAKCAAMAPRIQALEAELSAAR